MTDEPKDEQSEKEAQRNKQREGADVETAELSDEELEKLAGGHYTSKNTNSPFVDP